MPTTSELSLSSRWRRRRMLLALCLVPAAGCASRPRLPWSPRPTEQIAAEQEGRVAVIKTPPPGITTLGVPGMRPSVFRMAAFRNPSSDDVEIQLGNANALTDPLELDKPTRTSESRKDMNDLKPRDVDRPEEVEIITTLPQHDPPAAPNQKGLAANETVGIAAVEEEGTPVEAAISDTSDTIHAAPVFTAQEFTEQEFTPQVIDMASTLGMAGGNAWAIQLARQKTVEAHAELQQARALWLPTLQMGVGWNKHDGRIQATEGVVSDVSRNSLFVGGGATLGQAPVAGGSGGPFRLFADLALADAYFLPQIADRQLSARRAGVSVAKNKALLDAGLAYVDLLEAAGQVSDADAAIAAADVLLNLTRTFAKAGAGAEADVDRAATAKARLAQIRLNSNRLFRTRSARLSRRLKLDPRFELQPADQVIVPIELLSDSSDQESLIATSLSRRPEVSELSHEIAGLCLAVKKAHVEPWIPYVSVTSSAGNFGGGKGSNYDDRAGRSDLDLQAMWQLESLGLGVAAKRKRAGSQLGQKRIELADFRDEITAEVIAEHENVLNYRMQIEIANEALTLADSSYERNLQRVRADEGLPIELLQAIDAKAAGLRERTAAVANYNRSQLKLLYATGQLGL